jgi:ABC-type nitrate/sulfonate/bicarbonate transport system permease component
MIETGHTRAEVNVPGRPARTMSNGLARRAMAIFSPAILWGTGSIFAGLLVWEAIYRLFHVSPLVLSPPSAIATEFAKLTRDGTLALDIAVSAQQFFIGYIVASAIAVGIGLLFGVNRTFRHIADPWV